MNNLSQEHRTAVADVFKSPSAAVLKHLPQWGFALGEQQFSTLKASLKKMAKDLGSASFILEITQLDDSSGSPLTAAAILSANSSKLSCITLGAGLSVLRIKPVPATINSEFGPAEVSSMAESTVLLWHAPNDTIMVFADGRVVDYFDMQSPNAAPAMAARFRRRADDYELSIIDHYLNCVRYGETDHWHDRGTRRLRKRLGSATNTEAIFHRDLHLWLKINLEAQVFSKAKDTSSDELDLLIIAPSGRTYVAELKWMGTSSAVGENDFSYTIKTVKDGLNQLREYLNKQPRIVRGSLVTYDGRIEKEFAALQCSDGNGPDGCKRLASCDGVAVAPRANCIILFLESKTASE